MLLEGSIHTNKTEILVDEMISLINAGTDVSSILVLTLNSYKKERFINELRKKLVGHEHSKFKVYTFFGLAYRAFLDNWSEIKKLTKNNTQSPPNLCGLEISQYIFKKCIREAGFNDYLSKINLLHQLFRRRALIVQNSLTKNEVKIRADILKESFFEHSQKALDLFDQKTIDNNAFDYLRQLSFLPYIYKKTDYFKNIEYLFVDDADEVTNIELEFIKYLKPQLKRAFIAYDKLGASRCGYLSADRVAVAEFEKIFDETPQNLEPPDFLQGDEMVIFNNLMQEEKNHLQNTSLCESSKRCEMIESAIRKINLLLSLGAKPSEISIVTPIIDETLRTTLKDRLNVKCQFLSGSEKLVENSTVKGAITILKLANVNAGWNLPVDVFELRALLNDFLGIPLKYCKNIIENFKKNQSLCDFEFRKSEFNHKYQKLKEIINKIQSSQTMPMPLSEQISLICTGFIVPSEKNSQEFDKFDFFLKEISSFESLLENKAELQKIQKEIIIQLENTIISENPSRAVRIEADTIVVASSQKIIDLEIVTHHQFWLDLSHHDWMKQDIGTIYNSWVFQKNWDKPEFEFEDNLVLTKEKTARVLRKLALCVTKKIHAYSSIYDNCGLENFGELPKYILSENEKIQSDETQDPSSASNIVPRDDQKPVLGYKQGEMAIAAVPGAGKTTVLQLLILKLLKDKIKPENIFVLTYMESAARNFKDRIRQNHPKIGDLPYISTIHGLALRIIKENSNYAKLNLSHDFEICDENQRQKILREIFYKMQLPDDKYSDFDRAISTLKFAKHITSNTQNKDLALFLHYFNEYNKKLSQNNLIDYDDMLKMAVELLEKNQDILQYYQNLCHYVIEDEAQDSSSIQQKLLSLLSGKYNNLIRCGDINQAITSTFTNADIKGFWDFVNDGNHANKPVLMSGSQRCAKSIYELANNLIDFTKENATLRNTFYNLKMQPTQNNPKSIEGLDVRLFDDEMKEKIFILNKIRNHLSIDKKLTIAILVRNNYQLNDYRNFLAENGLNIITRTDCLEQNAVFKVIFAIFKWIEYPYNNKLLLKVGHVLQDTGLSEFNASDFEFLANLTEPFISANPENLSPEMLQFQMDMDYWLNCSTSDFDTLAVKIGLYYFKTQIDKSNAYLISILIKRLSADYKTVEKLIEKLEEMSKKPSLSGFKFFADEDEAGESQNQFYGKIQIMTLHKAKGDEFDVVFLPELTQEIMPISSGELKLKSSSNFIENVKALDKNYVPKTAEQLKIEQIQENLRLLYVGITRAKKNLYISCAKKYKKRSKSFPCGLFNDFFKVNDE